MLTKLLCIKWRIKIQIQGFEAYSPSLLAQSINHWIAENVHDSYRIQIIDIQYNCMVNSEGIDVYSALMTYEAEKVG